MAISLTKEFLTIMGDRVVGCYKLTHDGSSTTVNLPIGVIEMAMVLTTHGSESTGTTVSWSGKTLTVSAAGTNTYTDYVFFVGVG